MIANTAAIRTALYSYPPSVTHGPLGWWTFSIATVIVPVTAAAPSGVAAPSTQQGAAAGLGHAGRGGVHLPGPQPQ